MDDLDRFDEDDPEEEGGLGFSAPALRGEVVREQPNIGLLTLIRKLQILESKYGDLRVMVAIEDEDDLYSITHINDVEMLVSDSGFSTIIIHGTTGDTDDFARFADQSDARRV